MPFNAYFVDIASYPHYDSQVQNNLLVHFLSSSARVGFRLLITKFSKCCLKLNRLPLDLISCHIGYFANELTYLTSSC
jgi:hypothetical protein